MLVLLYVWADDEEQGSDGNFHPMLLRYTTVDGADSQVEATNDVAEPAPESACTDMGVSEFDLMMQTVLEGVPTLVAHRAEAAAIEQPPIEQPNNRRLGSSLLTGFAQRAITKSLG